MIADHFSKKDIWTFMRVILFYFTCTLLFIAITGFTNIFSKPFGELLSVILASLLTLAFAILFAKWEHLSLRQIGIIPGRFTIKRFFSGCLISFLAVSLQVLIVYCFNHLTLKLVHTLDIGVIFFHVMLYFFVACREELVFRSYALRALNYKFRSVFALFVITVIFIVEHLVAGMEWKMAVIGSGLGGLLFGIAALKTKGLALPMGLHFAWNFGQWITGFKNQAGIWEATVDKGYETETQNIGLGAYVFAILIALALILRFYKNQEENNTSISQDNKV
ncbi:CPBP family intramembrane metalloprotease [Chryseobacterium daecheongense]|uniref:CPBP family intramembrane glutamic endopeptidase n=1 Tax=Chryseobacterium daecheongense TaxID=192389 RepID=UPI001FD6F182|nr:type II CAAX endopeptidase family protein [Chryseobacterium daecheongense]UOU98028.1 CPBP family intramembrane metalloprotease [Chryseobacterium daecheongense]